MFYPVYNFRCKNMYINIEVGAFCDEKKKEISVGKNFFTKINFK